MQQGWERKWTDDQKEAVAVAYVDRKLGSYKRIAQLAAAGELTLGETALDPFPMPVNTIKGEVSALRKRRAGLVKTELAGQADAIEVLRRRLIAVADAELRALERRKVGNRDMERHRQIARAVREAAAIPLPGDKRPAPLGQRDAETGEMTSGATRAGLAGAIFAAHKKGETAPDAQNKQSGEGTQDTAAPTHASAQREADTPSLPGGAARNGAAAHS